MKSKSERLSLDECIFLFWCLFLFGLQKCIFFHVFILLKINTSRSNCFLGKMLVLYKSLLLNVLFALAVLRWRQDLSTVWIPLLQIGPGLASPTAIPSGPCAARRQRWPPSRWHRTGSGSSADPSSEAPNEKCRSGHWTRLFVRKHLLQGEMILKKAVGAASFTGYDWWSMFCQKRCRRKAKKATVSWISNHRGSSGSGGEEQEPSTSVWNHPDSFLLLRGFQLSQPC